MTMNKYMILFGVLLLNGCGALYVKNAPDSTSQTGFEVLSTQSRGEQADRFCGGFTLTTSQAETFFNRGKEIDTITMHNEYDWLNCYVEGRLSNKALGFNNCSYSIQAAGTAEIQCGSDKAHICGCNDCDDLLRLNSRDRLSLNSYEQ